MHPHFAGNGRQYLVSVFQPHPKHGVGQGFHDGSVLFNEGLFRHTDFGSAKIGVFGGITKKEPCLALVVQNYVKNLRSINGAAVAPRALWSFAGNGSAVRVR